MAVSEDVAAARAAVLSLTRAVEAITRHYADTVDVRRLRADVGRIEQDLDLLCGTAVPHRAGGAEPAKLQLEVVPDSEYSHDFWMDAEDEGLGRADRYR